jgi:hypothetical protein
MSIVSRRSFGLFPSQQSAPYAHQMREGIDVLRLSATARTKEIASFPRGKLPIPDLAAVIT